MKKLLFTLSILTLVLNIFTSCDKDDDDNSGSSKQKRLVMSLDDLGNSINFEYDNKGRMTAYTESARNYSETYKFNGKEFSVTESGNNYEWIGAGKLNSKDFIQNIVVKDAVEGRSESYIYDSKGQITTQSYTCYMLDKMNEANGVTITYEWKDGNIVGITELDIEDDEHRYETKYTLMYTNKKQTTPVKNVANIVFMNPYVDQIDICIARSSVFGVASEYLPVAIVDENGNESTIDWELDEDGYPTKVTETYDEGSFYYMLSWE